MTKPNTPTPVVDAHSWICADAESGRAIDADRARCLERDRAALVGALRKASDVLSGYSDVRDGSDGVMLPNAAMSESMEIDTLLRKIEDDHETERHTKN